MLIDSFSPQFPVSISNACSCLDISRSGYYDWVARNRLPHQIDAIDTSDWRPTSILMAKEVVRNLI